VQPGWRERLKQARAAIASGLVILAGLGVLAGWLTGSKFEDAVKLGGWFSGGLLASLLLLMGFAWLLLRGIRRISPWTRGSLRHGLANLYRPGNQAELVLVSIGVGVMFTLTVYLVQHSLLKEIAESAPPGMPNVFLIDITDPLKDGVTRLVNGQPGVEKGVELIPSVAARITRVNGEAIEKMDLKGFARRFLQTRSVTWSAKQPQGTKLLRGKWFAPGVAGQLAVTEETSKVLQIKVGDNLDWTASGKEFRANVTAIYRQESVRAGATQEFIFDAETLRDLPVIYFAGLRVRTASVAQLQTNLYAKYPTISVVNIADVLDIIQEVVDQVAVVIRFISAFAILGGVIILAASVAGTRFRRIREVVILKTFGGTKNKIARIFSVEFLLLGGAAGVLGAGLAAGFTGLIMKRFFDEAEYSLQWEALVVAIVGSALVANFAGWLASARILGQKPLAILRED
jgi:putative ABC transport system permease protein